MAHQHSAAAADSTQLTDSSSAQLAERALANATAAAAASSTSSSSASSSSSSSSGDGHHGGGGGGGSSHPRTGLVSSKSFSTLLTNSRATHASITPTGTPDKLAIVMVGLPARGKSYIARKLARYLCWLGVEAKVFNVGVYRRETVGAEQKADFFDPKNAEAEQKRREISFVALQDLLQWFKEGGRVGFYDATNTTRNRRKLIVDTMTKEKIQTFFIESICDDPDLIRQNIQLVKLGSPDYRNMPPEAAIEDFIQRIQHYQAAYEPMDDELDKHLSYIRMIDVGAKFVVNRTTGYLQSRIVYFLMNTHIAPRAIYLTRHGESEYNVEGKIGGDAPLSSRGQAYARELKNWMAEFGPKDFTIWTSTLTRARQTAAVFGRPFVEWRALDELDAGECDGMTYEEIQEKFPQDFARRDEDKYLYRYPRGESYRDVVSRLEPCIMELERQKDVVVVGHQAVLRCLLAYFLDKPSEELPYVDVPLHTVIKLTPIAYGCKVEMFKVNVPAVNTYRPKPADGPTAAGH
ncbi:6-phosphofructo-2-kinase [Capsaspora owczarzaki ATCC 30864]|uniref:fructose-2,6-bisphosphate 2-phosphatase n=1 Tax=Capsaspora owczarzaki (strain ATCC 30864) TaxID=595528 RepID=A0A0D2WNN8_CAPO3|nr:6-phosphofructo-2-kinase [Capsaspora owczarzaki ATCC 30864]KJE92800.1 6-phosphofructo-2-kinase [Capsaspora owczarzaki ATCC 30864]|eukprot:XP_004363428.1 6-phosphofructo-2-kinase [Capsaspora owczarzaki ATCC 30864]